MRDATQVIEILESAIACIEDGDSASATKEIQMALWEIKQECDVSCKFCGKYELAKEAHLHDGEWVGRCCWDERLKASE